MESQPQNPEFKTNPEKFPQIMVNLLDCINYLSLSNEEPALYLGLSSQFDALYLFSTGSHMVCQYVRTRVAA